MISLVLTQPEAQTLSQCLDMINLSRYSGFVPDKETRIVSDASHTVSGSTVHVAENLSFEVQLGVRQHLHMLVL